MSSPKLYSVRVRSPERSPAREFWLAAPGIYAHSPCSAALRWALAEGYEGAAELLVSEVGTMKPGTLVKLDLREVTPEPTV